MPSSFLSGRSIDELFVRHIEIVVTNFAIASDSLSLPPFTSMIKEPAAAGVDRLLFTTRYIARENHKHTRPPTPPVTYIFLIENHSAPPPLPTSSASEMDRSFSKQFHPIAYYSMLIECDVECLFTRLEFFSVNNQNKITQVYNSDGDGDMRSSNCRRSHNNASPPRHKRRCTHQKSRSYDRKRIARNRPTRALDQCKATFYLVYGTTIFRRDIVFGAHYARMAVTVSIYFSTPNFNQLRAQM